MSELNNNTPNYDRLDSNGLLYMFQRLRTIFGNLFQAKETGKGLSANDFTTLEKQKLAGIANGAEVNTLEVVKLAGDTLVIDGNRAVNIPVDSTLNDSSMNPIQNMVVKAALDAKAPLLNPTFVGTPAVPTAAAGTNTTQAASTAFVKTAIENALSGKIDLQFSFVQALPVSGVVGTFYFIPATNEVSGVDEWEEYVWNATDSQFERIGAATLDLTNYFNTTNLPAITNAQIDAILAT